MNTKLESHLYINLLNTKIPISKINGKLFKNQRMYRFSSTFFIMIINTYVFIDFTYCTEHVLKEVKYTVRK